MTVAAQDQANRIAANMLIISAWSISTGQDVTFTPADLRDFMQSWQPADALTRFNIFQEGRPA